MSSFVDWIKNAAKGFVTSNSVNKGSAVQAPKIGYDYTPYKAGPNDLPDPMDQFVNGKLPLDPKYVQGTNTTSTQTTTNNPYDPAAAAAAQEQAQKNSLIDQIRGKYSLLQSVFDNLFGGIDKKAKEQSDQLNQNYDTQQQDLNKTYENTAKQTAYMMGARGIGNSSYNVDAQNANTDVYNTNTNNILQGRQQGLGSIGNTVAAAKQQLNSQRSQYDDAMSRLGSYGVNDLNSLYGTVNSGLASAQNMAPSYMTQNENIQALNNITPVQNPGTSQLASRLQALVTSSAPIFAKRQIAQGLVKAANLTDPGAVSYWQNQFEDMLKNNGLA